MDIEELTNSQIILVTILVSFVISIGTAIITVALVKDTPITMPSVVNQVIQKTVEKESIVLSTSTASGVQNVQVVIKEDDTVATLAGLELARQRKIVQSDTGEVLGSGFYLSPSVFLSEFDGEAISILQGDNPVSLTRVTNVGELGLRLYASKEKEPQLKAVSIAKSTDLKIGQKVVALPPSSKTISIGYITSLTPTELSSVVETSIEISARNSGTLLYTLDGKLVGVLVLRDGVITLVPAELLATFI